MPAIAFVDDHEDKRSSIEKVLRLALADQWELISVAPLDSADDYVPWIHEHDIAVLLIDWCLNDSGRKGRHAVAYEADAVLDTVRAAHPTLPIFIVTAYGDNEDMQARRGDFEYHISREELADAPDVYVQRMLRAGGRFWERRQQDLARLSELARAAAVGTISPAETEELHALRTSLGMSLCVLPETSQAQRLAEAEEFSAQVNATLQQIKDFLEKNPGV